MPPKSGHPALIAIESYPVVPGTFVDVAQLTSDLPFEMTKATSPVTPHGDTIQTKVFSPVIVVGEVTVSGNFIHDNATHDDATGLQAHFTNGDTFGMLWKGPDWAAGVDEIIMSGQLTAFRRTAPTEAGVYAFEAVFEPSGLISIDGGSIGVVATP